MIMISHIMDLDTNIKLQILDYVINKNLFLEN